ncbi:hypothetical protein EDD18DRAFT_1041240, partial [Armillaria luteobubalina]
FFKRESTKFWQMFSHLTSPGKEPRDCSPDTVFRFSDVMMKDFSHFLWIFCHQEPSVHNASTDVWFTILCVACKQSFPDVKALAIKELEQRLITLVDPIILHRDYEV